MSRNAASLGARVVRSDIAKVYFVLLLLYLASGIIQPNYFSGDHIMQTLVSASFLGIIAMGQTLVILTGGIDLSVAYLMNLGAALMTQITSASGSPLAVTVVLCVGLAAGLGNGLGVAYLRISPLIMTLAMNSILMSATLVYTGGTPKGLTPVWLKALVTGSAAGVRWIVVVWVALAAGLELVLRRTAFGRGVYATGNNPRVAYLSGIDNRRVLVGAYSLSGIFAALGGMLMTGITGLSYLGMGNEYQLMSVTAVVIGGGSILGGKGSYVGSAAGAMIIFIVTSILTAFTIAEAGRKIIYGLIIIIVLYVYARGQKALS
ncbi:MAG: ABC transporter permease [Spirochaetia bacterium]